MKPVKSRCPSPAASPIESSIGKLEPSLRSANTTRPMPMMSAAVLIADDHPLFRQALRLAVEKVLPGADIAEAGTLAAAARAASAAPDLKLILLDLKMPGAVGYSGIALLHAECPDVPILVVSSAEGAAAADEARVFGAIGFLHKGSDLGAIEAAITQALGGHRPSRASEGASEVEAIRETVSSLTPTQLKVLLAVLDGQLNKQIRERSDARSTRRSHSASGSAYFRWARRRGRGRGRPYSRLGRPSLAAKHRLAIASL